MLNHVNFIITRFVRWILPLLVVLLIALYLLLSRATFTHAAAGTMHHVAVPHTHTAGSDLTPDDIYWPFN
jgi:hypothetical protein